MKEPFRTLPEFLLHQLDLHPHAIAYISWRDNRWRQITWAEFARDVLSTARTLKHQNVGPGDRVGLIAANHYLWPVFDLAIQLSGATSVPLSPLMNPRQAEQLLRHSEPVLVIAGTRELIAKFRFAGSSTEWSSFESADWTDSRIDDRLSIASHLQRLVDQHVRSDSLVSIIYTSGTTGEPKGVMLNQTNLVSNAYAKTATLDLFPDDVRVCWLPMSHIFSRLADLCTGWLAGCTSVISRGREFLFDELLEFRPHYLNGVPWLYDKCCRLLSQPDRPGELLAMLGGRIRLCNSGGAALPQHVLSTFERQGVNLVNGYGLTEASPVVTSNSPSANRPGSVGRAVPGVQIRVNKEQVVEMTGPGVMQGYYRNPVETKAAVTHDGWLKTGDVGRIDKDGYLWLTGRAREMIVTLTGRNISPVRIENQLLEIPTVHQCMIVGEGRRFLIALVVPEWNDSGLDPSNERDRGRMQVNLLDLFRERLADFSSYEIPARVVLIDEPFTPDNQLATPKQSLRRELIAERYANEIDAAYQ